MTGDERQLRLLELSVDDVEIRPAHAAGSHADDHLAAAGPRSRQLGRAQRLPRLLEEHRSHAAKRKGDDTYGLRRPLRSL